MRLSATDIISGGVGLLNEIRQQVRSDVKGKISHVVSETDKISSLEARIRQLEEDVKQLKNQSNQP